jgi:uncharacterized protein (DUF1778 family)
MSTTITIPTELEKKIAGRAATQGKDVEQFALEALERAAETVSLRELFADVREEIRASHLPEEELDAVVESAVGETRKQRRA